MHRFFDKLFANSARLFWSQDSKLSYLIIASIALLFFMLGSAELWTQEGRWAAICSEMILRKDYLHPYLFGHAYYDKPLFSYWLVLAFAYVFGHLNEWALRLPSALSGLLTIICCYLLGKRILTRQTGLLSAWMLLTSYYFVFWSRVSSADMLNVAGIMVAVTWYFYHREDSRIRSYTVFFCILAVSSLFKGPVATVLACLAILPELLHNKSWRQHVNFKLLISLIPAILIYLAPFILSNLTSGQHYSESGLYEVFRENVVRYVHPFDQIKPFYIYFYYLPIYMLPWGILLIPAIIYYIRHWRQLDTAERWCAWASLLTFLFLMGSGSRRSYYILPVVPFATLMTACWLSKGFNTIRSKRAWISFILLATFIGLFALFCILKPIAYADHGLKPFAKQVKAAAQQQAPWATWRVITIDAQNKTSFYLQNGQRVVDVNLQQLPPTLAKLQQQQIPSLVISQRRDAQRLQQLLPDYQLIAEPEWFGTQKSKDAIALLPVMKISRTP